MSPGNVRGSPGRGLVAGGGAGGAWKEKYLKLASLKNSRKIGSIKSIVASGGVSSSAVSGGAPGKENSGFKD